jgi:6-phosphogluconolactonase
MTLFYTGSYTQKGAPAANPTGKGIGCFHFDLGTGEISFLHNTGQRNPSYLAISEDKKFLYAVEEMYECLNPEVFAYRIGEDGALSLLNRQKISGDYACHLAIIEDRLVLANYVSGNLLSYPILGDGSLAPFTKEIRHEGMGPNAERQAGAHMHMIYPFGKNGMYVVDLSLDMAKAYHFDAASGQWIATPDLDIKIDAGSGARHMVMDQKKELAFVLGELTGDVFVVDLSGNKSKIIQKVSIIPENHSGDIGGAAIRLHPNGEFLYASNRGSDSISVFRIDKEFKKLIQIANHSTEGKTPRDFNIDPSGKWLLAANQDSNSLVVFEINQNDGTLKMKTKVEAETVVNICWL